MKIIKLTAENVKRIRAVEITPDGKPLVIIGGRNGQGKSSALDSIIYGLGGAGTLPAVPVRRGMKSASIDIDLGELFVHRSISASGATTLTVKTKDGVAQRSPQAILDKLDGTVSFDPLSFTRLKPAEQAETLRGLAGLDFTAQDKVKQAAYDERLAVGRDLKAAEARLAAVPTVDPSVPDEEVSASAILVEQSVAVTKNRANDRLRRIAEDGRTGATAAAGDVSASRVEHARLTIEVDRLTLLRDAAAVKVETAISKQVTANKIADHARQAATGLTDIDLSPFESRCRQTERLNEQVRAKKERRLLETGVSLLRVGQQKLTQVIEEIDKTKRELIAAAKFPVAGLAFSIDGAVEFNNLPFAQASDAEKIQVSVAIGLALNPKLRVLMIRDGSLLDADSLRVIGGMAAKADAQIWIERVGTGEEVSVVIEDGAVLEEKDEAPQPVEDIASSVTSDSTDY